MANALREEVNPTGIRVLNVFPGRTATPRMKAVFTAEGKPYRPEVLMQPDRPAFGVGRLGHGLVGDVGIGLQDAAEVLQQRRRVFVPPSGRVRVDHRRRITAAPRPVVAGDRPEVAGLGPTAARIEHRRRRLVDEQSRRIVGWSMATTLHTQVVLDALDMALGQRRPSGVIHHSDQGSQYTSIAFGKRCREAAVRPSMGSVGDAYDNAMAESFFATLECELLDRRRFKTQAEARIAVFEFIEGFYNPRQRHSSLGYLSPIDYERRHDQKAADPSAHHRSAVLGAVKVRPGDVGACVDAGATADLDRPCARQRQRRAGRDGKTNSAGAEQKNSRKQEDKMPSLQIP